MYDPENELGIPKQSWLKFKISVLWNCGYFYRGFSFLSFCLFAYLFGCFGWVLLVVLFRVFLLVGFWVIFIFSFNHNERKEFLKESSPATGNQLTCKNVYSSCSSIKCTTLLCGIVCERQKCEA